MPLRRILIEADADVDRRLDAVSSAGIDLFIEQVFREMRVTGFLLGVVIQHPVMAFGEYVDGCYVSLMKCSRELLCIKIAGDVLNDFGCMEIQMNLSHRHVFFSAQLVLPKGSVFPALV